MVNLYSNMHQKYSISKTLRFELIPIGETKSNIEKGGFIEKDEHRSELYTKVKKYCDEYHKIFIDECLSDFEFSDELLNNYYTLVSKSNLEDDEKETVKAIKTEMRELIANKFKNNSKFDGLFGKNMIESYLQELYSNNSEKLDEISEFKRFVTYFSGFNTNRKNMYVEDEKSTSIAYRLINQNLDVFMNNVKIYDKIKEIIREEINQVEKELNEYIQTDSIDNIFEIYGFNDVLTQKGIECYNLIISGKSNENGSKIKGINEYINEYNQKNNEKIPKLTQLYKQILSDSISASFIIDSINSDKEVVKLINEYYIKCNDKIVELNELIQHIDNYDLNKIFLNNDYTITDLSQKVFGDWSKIKKLINDDYDTNYVGNKEKGTEKYEEERKNIIKKRKCLSLNFLANISGGNDIKEYIINYFSNNSVDKKIEEKYFECQPMLNYEYSEKEKSIFKDEDKVRKIKELLDELKNVQEFFKLLIPNDTVIDKDDTFYSKYNELYNDINDIVYVYNKVRNYLTSRPYSQDKIKINFENPTLLDGWDLNKETANLGVIFIKDGHYFLGIINPNNRRIFNNYNYDNQNLEDVFYKMEYKLLPGPNKMLPKVFFSNSRIEEFNPSEELLEKYNKGIHKKGNNFDLSFCHELIDFFKKSLNKHEEWKEFNFKFKDTELYNDIGEFYKDVEKQGYRLELKKYSADYINQMVEEGKLFLFQIYNKDFSVYHKGKENLHTMYWKALFDENNFKNIIYKLNGQAEIFYRKSSLKLEETTIHKANEKINNKNILNNKKESIFKYDLIKNRRYTVDKFQFHVPITINFINEGKKNLNEEVNKYLKYNDVNVIGIDRGERNLIYISVVAPNGEILEQYSLNEIINEYNNNKYITDYHYLLDKKEKEREEARESWKTVENIKELKEGYLSQVIHKIIELLDKYKAIIVLEDLNNGFKNSRIKVEKQVYQKFEKMLIEKLNYLVIKDKYNMDEGGLMNAWQLTNAFESFNKLGKQSGILFYIPAWCTSKIDPTTGFINIFNDKYESVDKSKCFFEKFDDIKYNEKENYFEFYADYNKFSNKSYGTRKNWIICSKGDRVELYKNIEKNSNWDVRIINDLTYEFKKLFEKYNIDFKNIKEQILLQNEKEFWVEMFRIYKLMCQMRNSIPESVEIGLNERERDYLISPVKNNKGYFYDSRKANNLLPIDADANGAYNIARKGQMCIEQLKTIEDSKLSKIKFDISNNEWLSYVQKKDN